MEHKLSYIKAKTLVASNVINITLTFYILLLLDYLQILLL